MSDKGNVSDGYHTFNELYDHRAALFIALAAHVAANEDTGYVWRSKLHSDGSAYNGWFVMGIGVKPGEQITYHLPMSRWDDTEWVEDERERARVRPGAGGGGEGAAGDRGAARASSRRRAHRSAGRERGRADRRVPRARRDGAPRAPQARRRVPGTPRRGDRARPLGRAAGRGRARVARHARDRCLFERGARE